jgi:hypothetical protein
MKRYFLLEKKNEAHKTVYKYMIDIMSIQRLECVTSIGNNVIKRYTIKFKNDDNVINITEEDYNKLFEELKQIDL